MSYIYMVISSFLYIYIAKSGIWIRTKLQQLIVQKRELLAHETFSRRAFAAVRICLMK